MGRNLDRTDSALRFDKYYKGCIFGLLPVLQFQSFKKLLSPHIKQKHVTTSKAGLKSESNVSDASRRRLRRTYSIHHLEPPSCYFKVSTVDSSTGSGETDNSLVSSHHRICSDADMLVDENVVCTSKDPQFGDCSEDFFDAFQIDKRLLLMKTSKTPDTADSAHCRGEVKFLRRETFRRSGSFPMSNKPCSSYGSLTPSKLESKVTEVWPSSSSSSSSSATDQRALDYTSNIRGYKLSRIRRASSLNDSLERYTQLFETSFSRSDAKLNISRSFRLSNEDEVGSNPADSGYLTKAQSMRDALQTEWPSDDIDFSKQPNKSASLITESEQSALAAIKDELSCIGRIDCSGNSSVTDEMQIKSHSCPYSYNSLPQLSEEAIKTSISGQAVVPQEGALKTEGSVVNALNILDALGAGNSLHKSPKLNNELVDEHLLSDLVNEALLDAYDVVTFDAYWPTPLCWNCYMHPLPDTEHHVTRKVVSKIKKLQSFSLNTDNSIDDIVSLELALGDGGWMKQQADAENLGLALDAIIFDELVDEIVYE